MPAVRDLAGHNLFPVDQSLSTKDTVNDSYTVVPSDTADLPNGASDKISCAVAGVVKVTYANGIIDTVGISAGSWHKMNVRRVWATGTTATGINVSS